MSNETNKESEMMNSTSDDHIAETADMAAQNLAADNDHAETIPARHVDADAADTEAMPTVIDGDDATDTLPQGGSDDGIETVAIRRADTIASATEDGKLAKNDDTITEPVRAENDGNSAEASDGAETGIEMESETETEIGDRSGTEAGNAASVSSNHSGYVPPSFASAPGPAGTYVRVPRDMPQRMPKPQPPTGPSKATIMLSLLPLFLGAVMLFIGSVFPMVFAPVPGSVDVRSMIAVFIVVLGALLIGLAVLLGLASLIHQGAAKWKARRRQ